MIPSWILDIFAAVMLVVAAVSAARLVAARSWQRGARRAALADIDIAHLLMGIAMASMLVPALQTLPDGAWEAIFGVMTAWFAYRVVGDARASGVRALAGGHCAPHLIHAGAMLYMFVAVSAPSAAGSGGMGGGGMSGMGTLELPFLALLFALALVGYSIWDLDQVSGPGTSGHYSLATARVVPTGPVLAGSGPPPGAEDGREQCRRDGCRSCGRAEPIPLRAWPLRCRRPVPRRTAPGFSPRGWRPAAGSRWASPWRSCC